MLEAVVFAIRLNRDGTPRKGADPRDIYVSRDRCPDWLNDLIAQYDDHGNPVVQ